MYSLAFELRIATVMCLASLALPASADEASADEMSWYAGIGGGVSQLNPAVWPGTGRNLELDDNSDRAATLYIGRDIDLRAGIQLQLYDLGDAEFTDEAKVSYRAIDASIVYRFFHTAQTPPGAYGNRLHVFARFSLGWMDRDPTVDLNEDSPAYLGVGMGVEWLWVRNLGLRGELYHHDVDAATASVSLFSRFGGRPLRTDSTKEERPSAPDKVAARLSETVNLPADDDSDGVADPDDQCPGSPLGYPVKRDGCALLEGVLSGVQFEEGTAELLEHGREQLSILAGILENYPDARIELHAHTDNRGSVRSQAILSRERLRTIGLYLLEQGTSARRLILRSFGASQPINSNDSAAARAANNRIEIFQSTE